MPLLTVPSSFIFLILLLLFTYRCHPCSCVLCWFWFWLSSLLVSLKKYFFPREMMSSSVSPSDFHPVSNPSGLWRTWSRVYLQTAPAGCRWCSTASSRGFWTLSDTQTTSDTWTTASDAWVWRKRSVVTWPVCSFILNAGCVFQASYYSDPVVLYSHVFSKGVGTRTAALYVAWAKQFEQRGMREQADAVYQKALENRAQPAETVLHEYR